MSEDENDPHDLDSGLNPTAFAVVVSKPSTDGIDGDGKDADAPVHAVGTGSGNLEHLTPRGRQTARETDVAISFETVVGFVADGTDVDLLTCDYADKTNVPAESGRRTTAGNRGTVVLMGDPDHSDYQFLGEVQRTVERPMRVILGTSSLQIAASRARTPMEGTRLIMLHKSGSLGADLDRLAEAAGERHLLTLPRSFD